MPCVEATSPPEREFFIDNLLVRIHFIIVMIRWTGLAPPDLHTTICKALGKQWRVVRAVIVRIPCRMPGSCVLHA